MGGAEGGVPVPSRRRCRLWLGLTPTRTIQHGGGRGEATEEVEPAAARAPEARPRPGRGEGKGKSGEGERRLRPALPGPAATARPEGSELFPPSSLAAAGHGGRCRVSSQPGPPAPRRFRLRRGRGRQAAPRERARLLFRPCLIEGKRLGSPLLAQISKGKLTWGGEAVIFCRERGSPKSKALGWLPGAKASPTTSHSAVTTAFPSRQGHQYEIRAFMDQGILGDSGREVSGQHTR